MKHFPKSYFSSICLASIVLMMCSSCVFNLSNKVATSVTEAITLGITYSPSLTKELLTFRKNEGRWPDNSEEFLQFCYEKDSEPKFIRNLQSLELSPNPDDSLAVRAIYNTENNQKVNLNLTLRLDQDEDENNMDDADDVDNTIKITEK